MPDNGILLPYYTLRTTHLPTKLIYTVLKLASLASALSHLFVPPTKTNPPPPPSPPFDASLQRGMYTRNPTDLEHSKANCCNA